MADSIGQPGVVKAIAETVANLRYMATRHRIVIKTAKLGSRERKQNNCTIPYFESEPWSHVTIDLLSACAPPQSAIVPKDRRGFLSPRKPRSGL